MQLCHGASCISRCVKQPSPSLEGARCDLELAPACIGGRNQSGRSPALDRCVARGLRVAGLIVAGLIIEWRLISHETKRRNLCYARLLRIRLLGSNATVYDKVR